MWPIIGIIVGFILWSLGLLLVGFSSGKVKANEDKAGILWINPGKNKDQYQFIFTAPLEDLPKKEKVWMEIHVAEKTGTLME